MLCHIVVKQEVKALHRSYLNATLTAKVISWRSVTHMCSLKPLLTQLSFQSHHLLFSNASAEVRGQNTPARKFASTRS